MATVAQSDGAAEPSGAESAGLFWPCDYPAASRTTPCFTCKVHPLAICAALEPDDHAQLERCVTSLHVDANATLLQEGDPLDRVYTVTRGMLRRVRYLADGRRQITRFIAPGDFLGLEPDRVYHGDVEAVTPTELCSLPRHTLEELSARFPALQDRLLAFACADLDRSREAQLTLGRRRPLEKVACFLVDLSERAARVGAPPSPLRLPMTRTDIADYLGLTIETVSRTFTRLRRDGLIRLPGMHVVELCAMSQLRQLAGRI